MKPINVNEKSNWETIIIGGGQAGLAAGYHLAKSNEDFVIIDASKSIGDSWRKRWDSLRLFTPAQYDGLPGLPFPAPKGTMPTKDEMAVYLKNYATRFDLPFRLDEKVNKLTKSQVGFEITTSKGILKCKNVIVATGTNPVPRIPEFARELDKSIEQIHSSQYKNPESLPAGTTLVVGSGTSGVEIAIELSKSRSTMISGNPTFHIPDAIFRYAGRAYWWFASNVLTIRTPIGRKARLDILKGGAPLISVSVKEILAAGVKQVPRVSGVESGQPKLEDGSVVTVSSILWATGFKPDFSWIDIQVTDDRNGWPITRRGVSTTVDGLYFVGMLFQFGLTSGLVGGVGRDAEYVVKYIQKRNKS